MQCFQYLFSTQRHIYLSFLIYSGYIFLAKTKVMSMESDLAEYLEYLCRENKEISALIVVSNEGLPIAITGESDQILISGMCTALTCIGKELVGETMNSDLRRILVDCSNGIILIQPLNQKGILVASCKNAEILSEHDISAIQKYLSAQHNHLVVI